MKLLRRRRIQDLKPSGPSTEAIEAHERAKEDLARVGAQTPGFRALGDRLRQIQQENHLAEAWAHNLKGSP